MQEEILKLRSEGKSYREIQLIIGCSKSTVSYYLDPSQKDKIRIRNINRREKNPLIQKVGRFLEQGSVERDFLRDKSGDFNKITGKRKTRDKKKFLLKDLIQKIGSTPRCYLTGRAINLLDRENYSLDHIIPASKGGDNSLENCGLACSEANYAKYDLLLNEFISLCKEVLENFGYEVKKNEGMAESGLMQTLAKGSVG